ncbi:cobaltochelatase subunit CobN [Campylobacter ureolyticus]|nr:cobaltochelatase subunit CobN [Campylobacter ureolyticus]
MPMNRQELAKLLNVSRNTLTNWEKEKPELIRLINQGLALDEQIEETKKYLEKLENIKQRALISKKINL